MNLPCPNIWSLQLDKRSSHIFHSFYSAMWTWPCAMNRAKMIWREEKTLLCCRKRQWPRWTKEQHWSDRSMDRAVFYFTSHCLGNTMNLLWLILFRSHRIFIQVTRHANNSAHRHWTAKMSEGSIVRSVSSSLAKRLANGYSSVQWEMKTRFSSQTNFEFSWPMHPIFRCSHPLHLRHSIWAVSRRN